MVIQACPRCAGRELDMPGFEDGMVPEMDNLSEYVCRKCDLRAVPLEFERKSDYEAFAAGVEEGEKAA